MAAAELLGIGTNTTPSSDLTIAAGSSKTVCLMDAAGQRVDPGAQVEIQLKASNGEYFTIDTLTGGNPGRVIAAEGVYRFVRRAAVSCGVFSG